LEDLLVDSFYKTTKIKEVPMERKQQTEIKVHDAMMGSGKTTYIIDFMNNNRDRKYIYITPNLMECIRIDEACPMLDFKHPSDDKDTKLKDLQRLVEDGQNVVSTHVTFQNFTKETLQLIIDHEYHLIIDEAIEPCVEHDIKATDVNMLFDSGYVEIADDGMTLEWIKATPPEYKSKFYYEYKLIENGNLVTFDFNNSENDKRVFIWEMTKGFLESFMSVTILTYQFNGAPLKWYFDANKVEYTIDTETIKREDKIGHFIKVYDNKDLNSLGNHRRGFGARSLKSKKNDLCERLSNNIYNFVNNKVKTPSCNVMWTTFKDCKKRVKGKGFTKGFVVLNQKATNIHSHKTTLAYGLNLFMNVPIKRYFLSRGVEVNEDLWSLNEMLQWIFRSAIRNGEQIHIYVPSARMRELLLEWIKHN
jgi:hypothetical protein